MNKIIFFFQKIRIYWKFLNWCKQTKNNPCNRHFYYWLCWIVDKQLKGGYYENH